MRQGAYPEYAGEEGRGMLTFAAVLLGVVGFFNLLDGIAAISHFFVNNARYVIGDLRAWGWLVTMLGALQLIAALGVAARNQAARWFAIAVVSLNAVAQMFFIPGYPFWSILIISIDVVALYALAVYGGKPRMRARPDGSGDPARW
jgi:hypothetical protein